MSLQSHLVGLMDLTEFDFLETVLVAIQIYITINSGGGQRRTPVPAKAVLRLADVGKSLHAEAQHHSDGALLVLLFHILMGSPDFDLQEVFTFL